MGERVVVITGCSTGIGLLTAVQLAKSEAKKYIVYATMRNLAKKGALVEKAGDTLNKNLFIIEMDVKSESSVKAAVKKVFDARGRIDVLVNNAGVGMVGALECQSMDSIKNIYETNVYGVIHCIKAVLPSMKKKESGQIITVSSGAGRFGVPLCAAYSSSKHAISGLTESLAPTLKQFNINISVVEPGPVSTEFTNTVRSFGFGEIEDGDEKTKKLVESFTSSMDKILTKAQKGEEVAECIQKVVETEIPNVYYTTSPALDAMTAKKYVDITGNSFLTSVPQYFK